MLTVVSFEAHRLSDLTDEDLSRALLGRLGRQAFLDDEVDAQAQQFSLIAAHFALGEPQYAAVNNAAGVNFSPPATSYSLNTVTPVEEKGRELIGVAERYVAAAEKGPSEEYTRTVLNVIGRRGQVLLLRWSGGTRSETERLYVYAGDTHRPSEDFAKKFPGACFTGLATERERKQQDK